MDCEDEPQWLQDAYKKLFGFNIKHLWKYDCASRKTGDVAVQLKIKRLWSIC